MLLLVCWCDVPLQTAFPSVSASLLTPVHHESVCAAELAAPSCGRARVMPRCVRASHGRDVAACLWLRCAGSSPSLLDSFLALFKSDKKKAAEKAKAAAAAANIAAAKIAAASDRVDGIVTPYVSARADGAGSFFSSALC